MKKQMKRKHKISKMESRFLFSFFFEKLNIKKVLVQRGKQDNSGLPTRL
jgi:hypothetical protein